MTGPTILVVDDERDIKEMIEVKFRKKIRTGEMNFLFAYDGAEALRELEKHPETNIILTDLNMPQMDGITLLKNLSGVFDGHAIIITAYGDYNRLRVAMNEGAFDFLNKPLDFGDLETTLERALHDQEAMRQRIVELETLLAAAHTRIAELEGQRSGGPASA